MLRFVLIILLLASCAPADPGPPALKERISGSAAPSASMRDSILAQTHAYWLAIQTGRLDDAYAFHALDFRERLPFPRWRNQRLDAWAMPPRVLSIHWTQAAQRHHGPELYAIVGWSARRGSAGSEGTLFWRLDDDGVFRLENATQRVLIRPPAG